MMKSPAFLQYERSIGMMDNRESDTNADNVGRVMTHQMLGATMAATFTDSWAKRASTSTPL